jgi:hypothetical protein
MEEYNLVKFCEELTAEEIAKIIKSKININNSLAAKTLSAIKDLEKRKMVINNLTDEERASIVVGFNELK